MKTYIALFAIFSVMVGLPLYSAANTTTCTVLDELGGAGSVIKGCR